MKCVAVSTTGQGARTTDGGDTWWVVNIAAEQEFASVQVSADGEKAVAMIKNGKVWRSESAGLTWFEEAADSPGLDLLAASSDGKVWVGAATPSSGSAENRVKLTVQSEPLPCQASTDSSKDGTGGDGLIYCLSEGAAAGTSGSCKCVCDPTKFPNIPDTGSTIVLNITQHNILHYFVVNYIRELLVSNTYKK
jgi:hypothetical protein